MLPLQLLRSITRGLILQKARRHPVLRHRAPTVRTHTVSGSFHSPIQGYFSPFPHGTSALSVTEECLGLGVGPPRFRPGFTCPIVLRYQLGALTFRLRDCYPLWSTFPGAFDYVSDIPRRWPYNPERHAFRFGLFPFRSPLLRESLLLSLIRVLRCFSSPTSLHLGYVFTQG